MAETVRMREYETIYIMRPGLDDNAAKELMLAKKELVSSLGGKNVKVTAMGRRKLAWERNKETKGIYVHHHFLGNPGIVKEFDRALSIDDNILLRHSVIIKKDVNPDLVKIEEDSLALPIFRERKEYSDRRERGFGSERDFDDSDYQEYNQGKRSYADDSNDLDNDND